MNKNNTFDDLKKLTWFHGGNTEFREWEFPPPAKPGHPMLMKHSFVFLTTDRQYATGAGSKLAIASLNKDANILNTITNYEASEKLRLACSKVLLLNKSLNVQHDYWHKGWVTGDVLRYAWVDVDLDHHFHSQISRDCEQFDIPREEMKIIFSLNLTRSLIEYICRFALGLGYDGLFGHEIDRHSGSGVVLAQPILAVLRENVISSPVWIQSNGCGDLIV